MSQASDETGLEGVRANGAAVQKSVADPAWEPIHSAPASWSIPPDARLYRLGLHFRRVRRIRGCPSDGERPEGAPGPPAHLRSWITWGGDAVDGPPDLDPWRARDDSEDDSTWRCGELDVSLNRVRSLDGLRALPALYRLDCSTNRVEDLSPVARLPGLRELRCAHNALQNLRPLAACERLQVLDVSGNPLRTLASLPSLPHLRLLRAAGCGLESIAAAAALPLLQRLDVDDNPACADPDPVAAAPSLVHLGASGTGFDSADRFARALGGCPTLRSVVFRRAPVADADGVLAAIASLAPHVERVNGFPVTPAFRERVARSRSQAVVRDLLERTAREYQGRAEAERARLRARASAAREEETAAEEAFALFQAGLQSELDDLTRHANRLLSDPAALEAEWLASPEGTAAWRRHLEEAAEERHRAQGEALERERREAEAVRSLVVPGAGQGAALAALRSLSYERPAVWRRLKAEEAAARERRETAGDAARAEQARQRAEVARRLERRRPVQNAAHLRPPETAPGVTVREWWTEPEA